MHCPQVAMTAIDDIDRPSPEERDSHYKAGSIKRVKLINFLTYDAVEFFPGPRLNVVVGPNGTGKSTILCAICLGLGGQPPLLGRADDARLFIKHEKEVATIEIELAPIRDGPVHVLKRIIDRARGSENGKGKGASTYYINNHKSNEKSVKELVTKTYKINIDNLCTFLPQDKVGNFSGFDKQSLLIETEKSLSHDLYDSHQLMIQMEEEVRNSGNDVQSVQATLADLTKQNEKLERDKALMEERAAAKDRIDLLKKKRAWVFFENKREEAVELKARKDELKKLKKDSDKAVKPILDKYAKVEEEVAQIASRSGALDKKVKESKKQFDDCIKKSETFQDGIDEEVGTLNTMDAVQRKAQRDVENQRKRLQEIEAEVEDFPPMDQVETIIVETQKEIRSIKQKVDGVKRKHQSLLATIEEEEDKKKQAKDKLDRVKDEKKNRLNVLFGASKHAKASYEFVDQNRKIFRRPVWGPVAAEVQPRDERAAAYLENHVSRATHQAYIVECKEDYNLLYREVREKRKIPINIIVVPNGKLHSSQRMYSDKRMEVLRKEHGFECYLDETFTAPEAIMAALMTRHNVDKVIVGGEGIQNSLERKDLIEFLSSREKTDSRSGKQASCFFYTHKGSSWKYTSQPSRYTGEIGTDAQQIGPAKLLKPGTDSAVKEQLVSVMKSAEETIERIKPEIESCISEANKWTTKGQDATGRFKQAKRAKADWNQHKVKLGNQKDKLAEAEENASKDNKKEKKKLKLKIQKLIENSITMAEKAGKAHDEIIKTVTSLTGLKMSEDGLLEKLRKLNDILAEKQNETAELAAEYKRVDNEYNAKKEHLRDLMREAEKIAPSAEWKDRLGQEDIPATLEDIDNEIDEAELRINSITDNPHAIREYERRKQEIQEYQAKLDGMTGDKDHKLKQLKLKFQGWKDSLANVVEQVNAKMSVYMKEVGCAGEVRLYTGGKDPNENNNDNHPQYNLKNWGIEILVKFREASPLQVLSAQTHSGGERSVSTIMYLMGLQNLMTSPFRCVDEINQGLDERNERLVFKRIVANSTIPAETAPDDHCGQYFLITPKLLPNLEGMDNENITVLFVFSGSNNFSHFLDWNVDKFIQEKRKFHRQEITANRIPKSKKRRSQ